MELEQALSALEGFMNETNEKLDLLATFAHTLYSQVCDMQKVVYDDLIGGATNRYKELQEQEKMEARKGGIASLKDKYHDKFGPYEEDYSRIFGSPADEIYEKIFDDLEEMKSGEGYTDEMGDSEIENILNEFKAKFGDKMPPVAAVKVEETTEAKPMKSDEENLLEHVKNIAKSKKGGALALQPEY